MASLRWPAFSVMTLTACLTACPSPPPTVGAAPIVVDVGDRCDAPAVLDRGGVVFGQLTGQLDDVAPTCAATADLPDRVYALDIAEPATLRVRLDAGGVHAAAVAIFSSEGCETTTERACADVGDGVEVATAEVDAGRVFIVIDAEEGASYTLRVEVLPPQCVGDELDIFLQELGANRFAGAANGDDQDIDANPGQGGIQPAALHLCPADIDGFTLGHLGGPLTINVTPGAGEGTLLPLLIPIEIDPELTAVFAFFPQVTKQLDPIAFDVAAVDAPPGYYLLRVSEDNATASAPLRYGFTIEHGCEGDPFDSPDPYLDDATATREVLRRKSGRHVRATTPMGTFVMCGSDVDRFDVNPRGAATITVEIEADPDIVATVSQVDPDAAEPVPVTLTDVITGTRRSFTWDAADFRGSFDVTLRRPTPALDDGRYRARVIVTPLAPANATCDAAVSLGTAETPTTLEGSTFGVADAMTGLCNADATVPPGDRAGEVFYAVDVPDQSNLELTLIGLDEFAFSLEGDAIGEFEATVSLFASPGEVCPVDLETLAPIGFDGAPLDPATDRSFGACSRERLRVGPLAAGSYLAVVDGLAPEGGPFELTTQLFPGGFLLPPACLNATEVTLPPAGETLELALAAGDPASELIGSCGGLGVERVVALLAATTVQVTARTTDPGLDTTLYVRRGACDGGTELACDDDVNPPARDSEVTFTAEAGVPTFIVVDSFSNDADAVLGNTLRLTVAP